MKILIIGGTGHIGMHLSKQLIQQGHNVFIGSRGNIRIEKTSPLYGVTMMPCDSQLPETYIPMIAEEFDTVIFFPGEAHAMYQAFRDHTRHIIVCGSLWMYGNPRVVPTPEVRQEHCVFEGYEQRYQEISQMIADSANHKAVVTAIMPPNVCGPGKIPLDTLGGRDIEVHRANMRGEKVYLPDNGDCLIGPCDAEDIANLFALAANNRTAAASQIFNAGSAYSLTATQFVRTMADIYHATIPIEYMPLQRYCEEISPGIGYWWHFFAHMMPDISKARKLLGYEPRYTPENTLARAVEWMRQQGLL